MIETCENRANTTKTNLFISNWKLGHINRSYTYALPMLYDHQSKFWTKRDFQSADFVNCFISSKNENTGLGRVYLLYKSRVQNRTLGLKLRRHSGYICEQNFRNNYCLFIFKVQECFSSDLMFLSSSMYSKLSDNLKQQIFAFHNLSMKNQVAGVMYETEARFAVLEEYLDCEIPREQEASGMMNWEYERFDRKLLEACNKNFSTCEKLSQK